MHPRSLRTLPKLRVGNLKSQSVPLQAYYSSFAYPVRAMATGTPSATAQAQAAATSTPSFSSLGIKNTSINEGSGVQLSSQQKVLVGSVLDLFAGHPSLKLFTLWSPKATFTDPLTVATGADRYKAQWYGLPALFDPIRIRSHRVTSAGNPIELELSNVYTAKGIKKEQTIDSVVRIHLGDDGKIEKVEDKWNGTLPEGAVSEAFRKLNAVTVPAIVKVPKTEEEDARMRDEREATKQG